jgi:hypothetical protein
MPSHIISKAACLTPLALNVSVKAWGSFVAKEEQFFFY